ncbi:MAG: hypothetical protein Ta2B_26720 [Termitinemataceae bacterium]|nr:MAG: hypothetical protein Ta2B_26720 [Termitinemataceae bacterium]
MSVSLYSQESSRIDADSASSPTNENVITSDTMSGTAQENASNTTDTTQTVADFRQTERTLVFPRGEGVSPGADVSVFAIFRILFILVLVCAAIYGVIFFLKHYKKTENGDDTFLKVLARSTITPKTAAAVVSVGKKAYLLGISDNSVNLISEITDQEAIDAMQLSYNSAQAGDLTAKQITFNQVLGKIAGLINKKPTRTDDGTQNVSEILNKKRNRLKDL